MQGLAVSSNDISIGSTTGPAEPVSSNPHGKRDADEGRGENEQRRPPPPDAVTEEAAEAEEAAKEESKLDDDSPQHRVDNLA